LSDELSGSSTRRNDDVAVPPAVLRLAVVLNELARITSEAA
jgi:hypothetical protein